MSTYIPKTVSIEIDGKIYVLNQLDGWVTLTEYKRMFKLKTVNVLNNWIARKIIPPENIIEVPELNNLKLIKAKLYNTKPIGRPQKRHAGSV